MYFFAFMRQNTLLFDQFGYKKDVSYRTDDHLLLPPNDNLHEKPSFFESVISSPLPVITQIDSY
jgi:hypothetical protein